jgi:hypothetical protein
MTRFNSVSDGKVPKASIVQITYLKNIRRQLITTNLLDGAARSFPKERDYIIILH